MTSESSIQAMIRSAPPQARQLSMSMYRVGGGVTPAVRPHHRAYGTVHGGSREARPSLKKIEEAQESPFRQ